MLLTNKIDAILEILLLSFVFKSFCLATLPYPQIFLSKICVLNKCCFSNSICWDYFEFSRQNMIFEERQILFLIS